MATTRRDIEQRVALLLGEDFTSPGFGEPEWLRQCVVMATDDVARQCDAYYTYYTLNMTGSTGSPMTSFCAPRELYKLKRVVVTLSNSSTTVLTESNFLTREKMDNYYPSWSTTTQTGTPTTLILARPDWILYPYPTWSNTAGLKLYGFGVPAAWSDTGTAALTDNFPLAEYCVSAVVFRAAWLRSIQFPSRENVARQPMLKAEMDYYMGLAERDAHAEYGRH